MRRVTLDGFVLRFPRTGIVNYVYNVAEHFQKRPDIDLAVLLEDLNFSDGEIADFARTLKTRLVEKIIGPGRFGRMTEYLRNRNLDVRLPTPREISRMIDPGDIYHATDWYHYPSRNARANILTYFDLTTKLHPQYHEHTNIVKERRKAAALPGFDHVVAISDSTRKDLIEHCRVPPEKVSTVHLGVDRVYESPRFQSREIALSKYGIDPARRYILSVSTIEPRKNIIGILNAYRSLCDTKPAFREIFLVLSGHMGWRNEGLKQYLATFPYTDSIIFPGYVSLSDMPSLYHHAEAFAYLSFYEGFGLPILEAMKCSCPVVCSNTSSMPEVIGECGELVSPSSAEEAAAALARIIEDPTYADSLRFAGLVRSRKFGWAKHAEDLVRIYDAL
jgi:glycosyltransferase involved in cell wall biosynthesis